MLLALLFRLSCLFGFFSCFLFCSFSFDLLQFAHQFCCFVFFIAFFLAAITVASVGVCVNFTSLFQDSSSLCIRVFVLVIVWRGFEFTFDWFWGFARGFCALSLLRKMCCLCRKEFCSEISLFGVGRSTLTWLTIAGLEKICMQLREVGVPDFEEGMRGK